MSRIWQLCFGRISKDSSPKASLELSGHKDSTQRHISQDSETHSFDQGANGSASHTSCKQRDALQQERIGAFYLAWIGKSCCTPGPEILVLFVASGLNAWLMLYKACMLQSLSWYSANTRRLSSYPRCF